MEQKRLEFEEQKRRHMEELREKSEQHNEKMKEVLLQNEALEQKRK